MDSVTDGAPRRLARIAGGLYLINIVGGAFAIARARNERSILATAVFALAADPSAKQRILDNARTGGAALWLVAPTRDHANHPVALLADYSYSSLRYYGQDGVADVQQDAD
jgi:hypothetical protein